MTFNDKNHVFKHFKRTDSNIYFFSNTQNINASNRKDTD